MRQFFEIMAESTAGSSEHQKKRVEGAQLFKKIAISGKKLTISDDNAYVIFVPIFVQQLLTSATKGDKDDRALYKESLSVIVDLTLILSWALSKTSESIRQHVECIQ